MEGSTYWIASDKKGDITIHQYEPFYNALHDKWKSSNCIYVTRGMMDVLVTDTKIDKTLVIAYAYEVSASGMINNKVSIVETKKIYKDNK